MVASKNKGNGFERKISNLFSARFKNITRLETSFRRNPDSGSFWGASNQSRTLTHDTSKASFGDIISPDNFNYNIECKFYKSPPSFSMMLKQDIKQWDEWISQAKQDATNSKKQMLIIIKYNGIEEFTIIEHLPSEDIVESFRYKSYFVVPLSKLLSLPDQIFFQL